MSPKKVLRSPIRLAVVALASVAVVLVLRRVRLVVGSTSSGATSDTSAKSTTPTSAAAASGDTVNIKLIAYKPGKLTVSAGSTVTWHQMDPGVHTVTSGHRLAGRRRA